MAGKRRSDRAAGSLSTAFGVGAFLILLTFAAHLLINLWISTSIRSVALDAATDLASARRPDDPQIHDRVIAQARDSLGEYGDRLLIDVENTPEDVRIHVRAPFLHRVPPGIAQLSSDGGFDEWFTVRKEGQP